MGKVRIAEPQKRFPEYETFGEIGNRLGISKDVVIETLRRHRELGNLIVEKDWRKNSNGVYQRRRVYYLKEPKKN